MLTLQKETAGEIFLKKLKTARISKASIFSLIYSTLQNEHTPPQLNSALNRLKEVNEAVIFEATLAKLQIERNGMNIRRTIDEIKKIKVIGEDNFKYKMIQIRKLNLLAAVKPDIMAYLNLAGAVYIQSKYGNIHRFKKDFSEYLEKLHEVSDEMALAY